MNRTTLKKTIKICQGRWNFVKRRCLERRGATEGRLQGWFQKFRFRDRKKIKKSQERRICPNELWG